MDRILIILKKENGPRASSAPALGLNTILFKHVHWYMQQTQVSVYRTIGPLVYKIKRKFTLILVNTNYIPSTVLKTLKFSLVLCSRGNSDVYNTLGEIYLVFISVCYLQRPQPSTQLPKVKEESPTKIAVGEASDTIAGKMSQYN